VTGATYVTIADENFFVGAVALINSLRLTGNDGRIVVLDAGLTERQRRTLAEACDVCDPPVSKTGVFVVFLKPAVCLLGLTGTVVLVDSDVIVTRRFSPILDQAAAGKICVIGSEANPNRRFPDAWRASLGLRSPVRVQGYMGAGLIALDIDRWGDFMQRWLELCELVPPERSDLPFELPWEDVQDNPFSYPEMDVMNALFMSEVPSESIVDLGLQASPGPPDNDMVRILDRSKLRCLNGSEEPYVLHYWNRPKAWLRGARPHLAFDAYVELMARLLSADDVPVRVDAQELPIWLRDELVGKFVRRAPRRARRVVRRVVGVLPEPLKRRARDIGGSVADRIRLG
jgi:hypothetical protein